MPARILIIEDNAPNMELMSYLLSARGHRIIAARDGREGLEAARRESPDLVLCDVGLPGMNGTEIVAALRRDPAIRGLTVIAVTAFAMVGDRETIMAAGFDGYFSKPIVPESFAEDVEERLPAALRGKAPVKADHEPGGAAEAASSKRSILVVDDRAINRDLAESLFGGSGYAVTTATTVAGALSAALANRPDVIVSDVCLGEGEPDGFRLVEAIRNEPALRSVPFAFLSATVTDEAARSRGLALGADRYLVRPIEPARLLAEIERLLESP